MRIRDGDGYVEGSPFQIGDVVTVIGYSDDTGDLDLIGLTGIVRFLDYDGYPNYGYPHDPEVIVSFDLENKTDSFYLEELKL